MPFFYEPTRYEKEERLKIPTPANIAEECWVISGFADFSSGNNSETGAPEGHAIPSGTVDDEIWTTHDLRLIVGPEFHEIKDVSPMVAIAGYHFRDSDETDSTGIEIETCEWDTVGGDDDVSKERIRLKIELRMCGGFQSDVSKISYHVVAVVLKLSVLG